MTERPILFSAPMVRAILEGRKTQTRRVVKQQPPDWAKFPQQVGDGWEWTDRDVDDDTLNHWPSYVEQVFCPYGQPGDRLWVRETWCPNVHANRAYYKADFQQRCNEWVHKIGVGSEICISKWSPSIHMPRWASRITLEITAVRVERLNDISPEDAMSEGIEEFSSGFRDYEAEDNDHDWLNDPRDSFQSLWQSINGPGSWALNSWVWVVEFKRL